MSSLGNIQASQLGNLMGGQETAPVTKLADEGAEEKVSFGDAMKSAITDLNTAQIDSDNAAMEVASGRTENLTQALLTMEQANVSLRVATNVRNRIIEAYQEIMRMQI